MPIRKAPKPLEVDKLTKGQILIVKVPPFYNKEYLYEIISAGNKLIRASLYHSPTVKKQWSPADLSLLFNSGMIRFATEKEVAEHAQQISVTTEDSD